MLVCSQLPIVLRIFAGRIYKPGIQAYQSDFGSITILAKCSNFYMAVYNFSVHTYYTDRRFLVGTNNCADPKAVIIKQLGNDCFDDSKPLTGS